MHPSILAEIEQLPNCTVAQLRDRYEQVFGEPTGIASLAIHAEETAQAEEALA